MEEVMTKGKTALIAIGDIIIGRDKPKDIFRHVANVINSPDILFGTCDQTYSEKGYPYITERHVASPDIKNIDALVYAGLDIVTLANNHSMDLGPESMLDSVDRIRKAGIEVVGVGKNLDEARRPAILERDGNRVGFLAYGCIGPERAQATQDTPGHAPVRIHTIYKQTQYLPGSSPQIITVAYPEDLAAMQEDIRKLKNKTDVVAVSFHWGLHFVRAEIPEYEFEVGHAAVDAGADVILGGHPHILKGIEVYKGKVIFHSLANFAVEDFNKVFKKFKSPPIMPETRNTIIAKVIIEAGKIKKVACIPCYINEEAEPEIVTHSDIKGKEVFNYIKRISGSQNLATKFVWEGDEIAICP
jgi:poly-gamma-glutamate capsule biosynthesis protein CapA/YwtB (metallophosphatase superfamily)